MGRNLTFWPDEISSSDSPSRCVADVCQDWGDPTHYMDVVGIDFGSGEMHLYSCARKTAWKVTASAAREEILSLPSGTLVVGEWAHLATPRTPKSLAQPFSEHELRHLFLSAAASNITIKLFPHYHSGTRARGWVASRFPAIQSADKSDTADATALALYVRFCNGVSLANPPQSFRRDLKRDYGKAVGEYSVIALNAERTTGYKGRYFPLVIQLGVEMHSRKGRRIGKTACYSIASLIATELNGSPLMFVRNGRPPGVEMWWRYVSRMTPFHHKGGLARSNLMRHSFRPFLRKYGSRIGVSMGSGSKIIPFADHNDLQASTRTLAMKSFRDTVKDCYRWGIAHAVRNKFGMIDPIETPWSK